MAFWSVKNIPTKGEIKAKQIIQEFIDSKGMDIKPGTEEYTIFMRGILLGEYPDLTGIASEFIKNQEALDAVLDYAWKHSGYKDRYGGYLNKKLDKRYII